MNIRQLEAFRATVMVGTVSAAAKLLDVSQPSVSRLISQLEASLEIKLFERANSGLALTPEGMMLYEQVERAFSSVDKIREMALDINNVRTGRITIGCLPALGAGFLPSVIHQFVAMHPGVGISLHVMPSAKIEEWNATQNIDFGLAQRPFLREDGTAVDFCNVPYYAILPAGHPLSNRAYLEPKDFSNLPFISLTRTDPARHLIDQLFSTHGVNRQLRIETSYLSSVCKMVGMGMGVGLADPFSIYDAVKAGNVTAILMKPTINFNVGLMRPIHQPSKLASNFVNFMKKHRDAVLASVLKSAGTPLRNQSGT